MGPREAGITVAKHTMLAIAAVQRSEVAAIDRRSTGDAPGMIPAAELTLRPA